MSALQERWQRECPHVDITYVQRTAPGAVMLAHRYNEARRYASSHKDIDRAVALRKKVESAVS